MQPKIAAKIDMDDLKLEKNDFSLEDILAEYGGSRGQQLMKEIERSTREETENAISAPLFEPPEEEDVPEKNATEFPPPPRPVSLEEVVGSTVNAVMEEQEPLVKPRRTLFSRRKIEEDEDTERLFEPPPPEPEPVIEPIPPEPELSKAAAQAREQFKARNATVGMACLVALLPTVLLVIEEWYSIPLWSNNIRVQTVVLLAALMVCAFLCRGVFVRAGQRLTEKRITAELLIALGALASMGDCVFRLIDPTRTDVMPYAAVSCLALVFAQWGDSRMDRGMYEMFRTAAMDDEPPYLVTDMQQGACKQQGTVPSFYTTAMRADFATAAQSVLLPVIAMGALVFSAMTTLGKEKNGDFLLNLSILLCAGGTFSLPLCFSRPWSYLSAHLQKAGCAVAGWSGAKRISSRRTMIVTDSDLFPPGSVQLNGIKLYGEERKKAISYAASMTRAADCGLAWLFDGLLRSEPARYETVDGLGFYEEGGWSGTIRGETVLMGTASFLRKMEVRLPGDINLKTGLFLAVDGQLIAVFAVKYNPSENVDFALRMLRRNHITVILASRDPNVTPALLKRKFGKKLKLEYPNLTDRIALSEVEKDRDLPRALIFREGLLPYAETVVGSRRLVRTVRQSVMLSLLGSVVGLLLTAYLTALGAYELMSPLTLEMFLLLWTLPVILIGDLAARY